MSITSSTPSGRSSCWPDWALSGYMSERIAAGLLVVYFMLSIEVYLATYTLGTFHLSFWKFSPTELRILLMIGNLALLRWPMARVFGRALPAVRYRRTGGHCRDEPDVHRGGRAPHDRALPRRARLMRLVLNAGNCAARTPVAEVPGRRRHRGGGATGRAGVLQERAGPALHDRHRAGGRSRGAAQFLLARALDLGGADPPVAGRRSCCWEGSCASISPAGCVSIVSNLVLMRLFVGHVPPALPGGERPDHRDRLRSPTSC